MLTDNEISSTVQASKLAASVVDHACFAKVLMGARPGDRPGVYDLLAPHLSFAPWPLIEYEDDSER